MARYQDAICRTKPEVDSKRELQFEDFKKKQKQDFRGYNQTKHSTVDTAPTPRNHSTSHTVDKTQSRDLHNPLEGLLSLPPYTDLGMGRRRGVTVIESGTMTLLDNYPIESIWKSKATLEENSAT